MTGLNVYSQESCLKSYAKPADKEILNDRTLEEDSIC